MINNRFKKAYNVFKTIAKFNRKKIKDLGELENLRLEMNHSNNSTINGNNLNEDEHEQLNDNEIDEKSKPVIFILLDSFFF